MKTEAEHKYTSTGIKFWRHQEQMFAYRDGRPNTVVTTHVSPEGACNLKCAYCSVTYRTISNRIKLDVIKDYVTRLQTFGLKAVILTGGGEPTLYPHFNELVRWCFDKGLKVALITNGTQLRRVEPEVLAMLSWVRVSINMFTDWREKIQFPGLSADAVVGSSFVFTQQHQTVTTIDVKLLREVAQFARKGGAQYLRVLPNCLLPQTGLVQSHAMLRELLAEVGEDIIFHQHKLHRAPDCNTCHQSYFRPYLSEVPYGDTGVPGSVYPCDSVVLNESVAQFSPEYQLCPPDKVGDYLTGDIKAKFNPKEACSGCVFTDTVEMLGGFKETGIGDFHHHPSPLKHEEFV